MKREKNEKFRSFSTASGFGYKETYARTYLKEEIWNEQIVRKLEPFAHFLEVAAQCNGKILNFSKIGRDIGIDTKTVQSYYQILEDTLAGFMLPAFHRSVRKRQTTAPKFFSLIPESNERWMEH